MITIDPRTGSGELAPLFAALKLKHQLEMLPYGDFSFEGNGAHGLGLIGVERKTPQDLLKCMVDGRYVGKQLPGMLDYYDHCYLFVEGVTRPHPDTGVLQYAVEDRQGRTWWRDVTVFGSKRFMWEAFDHHITTLEQSKAKVRRTDNPHMTVRSVASVYRWYTNKTWDQHGSLRQLYSQPYAVMSLENKTSLVRRIAKEFEGIGVDKSLACHMKWRNPFDMITATVAEWMSIPGVGKTIAERVRREIYGETNDGNEGHERNDGGEGNEGEG